MNIESGYFELDPTYDPERLDSSGGEIQTPAHEHENMLDDSEHGLISYLNIPEYIFDINNNPYAFNIDNPLSLEPIAEKLNRKISTRFQSKNILIRALQSKHYSVDRESLLEGIINNGGDFYLSQKLSVDHNIMYAMNFMPWQEDSTILSNLEGFHKYKPKYEERPQYTMDIWMVFDAQCYENVAYLHPRHKVVAKDKWRALDVEKTGLLRIIVVN